MRVVCSEDESVGANFFLKERDIVYFFGFEGDESLFSEVFLGVSVDGIRDELGEHVDMFLESIHEPWEPT